MLFAWHMYGTDDVKLIRADDEEQAARVAIQARIDVCENSPEAAHSAIICYDEIWLVDEEKVFTAGDGVWDGPGTVGRRVHRV